MLDYFLNIKHKAQTLSQQVSINLLIVGVITVVYFGLMVRII